MNRITTVAELDELSLGAVLVDHAGESASWRRDAWQKIESNIYWRVGDRQDFTAEYVARRGPLELTWTPEAVQPTPDAPEACGICKSPFSTSPGDGGVRRYSNTGYCHGCVSACHEASDGHRCAFCEPTRAGGA